MTDILFIKLGALGDVINTLPLAIRLKKHMDARIHWLVAPLSYPLVSEHPDVDRVILFDKKKWRTSLAQVRQELKKEPFDMVLDLQRIFKSGLFAMSARAKRRIGFDRKRCKEMTHLFPFERIPSADPLAHMLDQYLEFGTYLGVTDPEITWNIPVKGQVPFDLPENYVVLNIGATKPANRWHPECFAELSEKIRNAFGFDCVLTGGPEDSGMARTISDMAKGRATNLVGKTTLHELKEVLFASKAVVSCDTGPMHFAVALGKKVVALFGPSDPRRTGPYKGHVIQKNLSCCPCNAKTCDDPRCMTAITPDDVLQGLIKALSD
ncbi:MAG: glycosyltransferase family 9 protein [Proteobacteria bacterium]|nr:glycosyltransferase family 9 protein [Pseudomonadota bacterium]